MIFATKPIGALRTDVCSLPLCCACDPGNAEPIEAWSMRLEDVWNSSSFYGKYDTTGRSMQFQWHIFSRRKPIQREREAQTSLEQFPRTTCICIYVYVHVQRHRQVEQEQLRTMSRNCQGDRYFRRAISTRPMVLLWTGSRKTWHGDGSQEGDWGRIAIKRPQEFVIADHPICGSLYISVFER